MSKKYASIEFSTQKKPHIEWYYMIWLCFRSVFLPLCDLYHVNLTSDQLEIIIFGTPEYHNLDTKTT